MRERLLCLWPLYITAALGGATDKCKNKDILVKLNNTRLGRMDILILISNPRGIDMQTYSF